MATKKCPLCNFEIDWLGRCALEQETRRRRRLGRWLVVVALLIVIPLSSG